MSSMKQDLRSIKTSRAIENAFIELATEKNFEDIHIKEIAERAEVNRNTIYLNYGSKEGIVTKIVNRSFTREFDDFTIDEFLKIRSKKEIEQLFHRILSVLLKNIKIYRVLLSDPSLNGYLQMSVKNLRYYMIEPLAQVPENEIVFDYTVNGVFGVAQKWLLYNAENVEQGVKLLTELTIDSIKRLKFK